MQFTNPTTGPFVVSGGTVDSVTGNVGGSVGSVTNPVTPDPASSIAVITKSVPFLFRDGAFWPCSSGEQFAPSFGTGWGYKSFGGHPTWGYVPGTSGTAVTTGNWPRIGYNGKTNLSLTFLSAIVPPVVSIADLCDIYIGSAATTRRAGFRFNATGVVGQYTVDCLTQASSALAVATFATGDFHAYEIDISTAGIVTFLIDGAVVFTTATNDWPSSATDNACPITATNHSAAGGFNWHITAPQYAWT